MNELKEKLAAHGLSPEQVDGVLNTIAEYVKGRVPSEYTWVVDDVLAGHMPDFSQLEGDIMGKLKGFLG